MAKRNSSVKRWVPGHYQRWRKNTGKLPNSPTCPSADPAKYANKVVTWKKKGTLYFSRPDGYSYKWEVVTKWSRHPVVMKFLKHKKPAPKVN